MTDSVPTVDDLLRRLCPQWRTRKPHPRYRTGSWGGWPAE